MGNATIRHKQGRTGGNLNSGIDGRGIRRPGVSEGSEMADPMEEV